MNKSLVSVFVALSSKLPKPILLLDLGFASKSTSILATKTSENWEKSVEAKYEEYFFLEIPSWDMPILP